MLSLFSLSLISLIDRNSSGGYWYLFFPGVYIYCTKNFFSVSWQTNLNWNFSVALTRSSGWLEPLLDRIARNASYVVTPIIDVIDDSTFQYHYGPGVAVGGFDWNLQVFLTVPSVFGPDQNFSRLCCFFFFSKLFSFCSNLFTVELDNLGDGKLVFPFKSGVVGVLCLGRFRTSEAFVPGTWVDRVAYL